MATGGAPEEPAARTALDLRERLGDDLAFLRAAHPREGWRGHANYGALADLWLGIHSQLRGEAQVAMRAVTPLVERTVAPADGLAALVPALNGFLAHLDQHHRVEDMLYFPRFRRLDARMAAAFDLLDADHHRIHAAIAATADAANALLRAPGDARATATAAEAVATLERLAGRHLADEEEIIIPAMLTHGERALDRP